jgi:hypothetical protein
MKRKARVLPRRGISRRKKKKSFPSLGASRWGWRPDAVFSHQSDVQSGSHQPPKGEKKQLDRSILPPKKVFIIKQILIESGLVFNHSSGWRPLGWSGAQETEAGGHWNKSRLASPHRSQLLPSFCKGLDELFPRPTRAAPSFWPGTNTAVTRTEQCRTVGLDPGDLSWFSVKATQGHSAWAMV